MIFTDQLGRTIVLDKHPKRIISLVPSQTELLADLALDEEVIGITKFCIHPDSWYRRKQRVGGTKNVDVDLIRSLKPDLIIGNKEENTEEMIRDLENFAPVWLSDISDLNSACDMIRSISELVGCANNGEEMIGTIRAAFRLLSENSSDQTRYKIKYFIWRDPNYVVGPETFIDDMLVRCGMENLIKKVRYPEDDGRGEPDLILLSSEPYPFTEKHIDEFKGIYPNAKILIVDGEFFSWYGSRMLKAPDYFLKLRRQINECISRP